MIQRYLSKLVGFKTLSLDHKENKKALDWYAGELKGLPLRIKRLNYKGFPSLFITTKNTKRPKILLQGHIDVVGGSPDLFLPKIRAGKFFGRGVFDMKYAAASYLELLRDLGQKLPTLDLGVLLTTDEEIGGKNGVGEFLNHGFGCKFFVLPDGGKAFALQKSAKGVLRLEVKARGKSAHGSRPWEGSNAIDLMIQFTEKLKKIFPKEPCGNLSHAHPTINIGFIAGGQEANKVPNLAEAKIDIRFTPGSDKIIIKKITAIKKQFPGIESNIVARGLAYSLPTHNFYYKNFVVMLEQEIGFMPKYFNGHGSSDAKFFIAKKIPGIVFRPVGGGHHSEKEWIDLKSLEQFCKVLKKFVIRHAGI